MKTFARYLLVQLPGWGVVSLVAVAIRQGLQVSPWFTVAVVGAWIAKDLLLYPVLEDAYRSTGPLAPADRLLGRRAIVEQDLDPDGYVRIRGELWAATLGGDTSLAARGTVVRVRAVEGLDLRVERDG